MKEQNRKLLLTSTIARQLFTKAIVLPLKIHIFNQRNKPIVLLIVLGLLGSDIFLTSSNSDFIFFGVTILFFITALFYNLKSKLTFIICLVLLSLMYVNFLFSGAAGPSNETEKIAVWLFLFMSVGIIQQWKE